MTNETAATGGVMYTDERELEFDENEIAAPEGAAISSSINLLILQIIEDS